MVPAAAEEDSPSSDVDGHLPPVEPDSASDRDEGDAGALGNQYTTSGDDNRYPFSSEEDFQIISQATRVVPLVPEDTIGVCAAKASKPGVSTPKAVESNQARYKVGAGKQPSQEPCFQQCIEVSVPVNGLKA